MWFAGVIAERRYPSELRSKADSPCDRNTNLVHHPSIHHFSLPYPGNDIYSVTFTLKCIHRICIVEWRATDGKQNTIFRIVTCCIKNKLTPVKQKAGNNRDFEENNDLDIANGFVIRKVYILTHDHWTGRAFN